MENDQNALYTKCSIITIHSSVCLTVMCLGVLSLGISVCLSLSHTPTHTHGREAVYHWTITFLQSFLTLWKQGLGCLSLIAHSAPNVSVRSSGLAFWTACLFHHTPPTFERNTFVFTPKCAGSFKVFWLPSRVSSLLELFRYLHFGELIIN